MATVSASELTNQVSENYAGGDRFYGLLVNHTGSALTVNNTLAEVVVNEISYTAGGYQRIEFFYSSSDINTYSSGVSVDAKRLTFTHDGTGSGNWTFNNIAILRVPAVKSSQSVKSVLSTFDQSGTGVDIVNNRITVSTYTNFDDGDQVLLAPPTAGLLPAGISTGTIYYVKKVSPDKIELHSNSNLSAIVDITGVSTGTGIIRNANGVLVGFHNLGASTTISALQSIVFDVSFNQGS